MKIDVLSRISEMPDCFTISDKVGNITGGVLEAILIVRKRLDLSDLFCLGINSIVKIHKQRIKT